ncbi:MAG: hypothetical protein IJT84_05040 [Clostridia bacterium]|nr:hypothetical protein [Clostridia bacterium]
MKLVEIHSHILPYIDDGAKDLETSIQILDIYKEQGVTDIFATPHFLPMEMSLEDFLKNRKNSFDLLQAEISGKDYPNIHLGAEVYYFSGISKSEEVKKLKYEGTNFILVELPIDTLSDYLLSDIRNINNNLGLVPIIAHIERVYSQKGFKNLLKIFDSGDALAQVNASTFLNKNSFRIAKKLLKNGYVDFIASDTHAVEYRAPKIEEGLSAVKTNFSEEDYNKILENIGEKFFNKEIDYDF